MTVTFRHLTGSRENLDVTILANFIKYWVVGNVKDVSNNNVSVTLEALSLLPENTIDSLNQVNSNRVLLHVPERVHDEFEEDEPLGDTVHRWVTSVQIDVWAQDKIVLGRIEDEINRILWEIAPTSGDGGQRLYKSDGNNPPTDLSIESSEVEIFQASEVQFDFVTDDDDYPDRVGSQAILKCIWFKDKS